MAEAGYAVAVCDLREPESAETVAMIAKADGKAIFCPLDVSAEHQLRVTFEAERATVQRAYFIRLWHRELLAPICAPALHSSSLSAIATSAPARQLQRVQPAASASTYCGVSPKPFTILTHTGASRS